MGLKLIEERLNGLALFEPIVHQDERGFFMETFRADEFDELGLPTDFVQDNHSRSIKNTLRGMHFQWDKPQGKLIRVTVGKARIVEIDIRKNSQSLGEYYSVELSSENKRVLWVPPGFANGFLALSDWCEMQYKCTAFWNPNGESSIRWNDPGVGIDWNTDEPILSKKDAETQTLEEWLSKPEAENFRV